MLLPKGIPGKEFQQLIRSHLFTPHNPTIAISHQINAIYLNRDYQVSTISIKTDNCQEKGVYFLIDRTFPGPYL
jgi:hypothetical protein